MSGRTNALDGKWLGSDQERQIFGSLVVDGGSAKGRCKCDSPAETEFSGAQNITLESAGFGKITRCVCTMLK